MLRIRLKRTGKKHQPHYRVVVAEHTAPVSGKYVASLGHFNPRSKELVLNQEDVLAWLNKGAQPSNTVSRLLLKLGMTHKLIQVHMFKERPGKKAPAEQPVPATAPVAEEATAETPESADEAPAEAQDGEATDADATPEAAAEAIETPVEPSEETPTEAVTEEVPAAEPSTDQEPSTAKTDEQSQKE